MCPRCGGVLREETTAVATPTTASTTGTPSLVSFLHAPATQNASTETDSVDAVEETAQQETQAINTDEPLSKHAASGAAVDETPMADEQNDNGHIELMAGETASLQSQLDPAPVATHYVGPSFLHQRAPLGTSTRASKWQWAALLVLVATLGLQILLADRVRLAADANWRPIVASLCRIAGCSVPAWHQPGAFAMLSRDVSPIPGSGGGLDVRATFRNDAAWPQAWPVLLLSLSDADGRVLGSRAFLPQEYLGVSATQTELAPGQSAQIALKLHEPNPDVVAFSFDFR